MERLLSKCTDRLSLLAAPATLDQVYDFGADAFDAIFDTLRMTTPCIVLDVPHQWSAWTKRALVGADDILIVAEPDLANHAQRQEHVERAEGRRGPTTGRRCIVSIRSACPSARKSPRANSPRRSKASRSRPFRSIREMFGTAANNGQMIAADRRQPSHHQDVSADCATADGPRRDQSRGLRC